MPARQSSDDLSVEELQQLLYSKKRAQRQRRLQRLKADGRVVDVGGLPPPDPQPPSLARPLAYPTGAMRNHALQTDSEPEKEDRPRRGVQWRWVGNRLLLLLEVAGFAGFLVAVIVFWGAVRELNREARQGQAEAVAVLETPVATPGPVIDVVVLPSGHKPPIDGQPPQPGEAGDIPAHLLPIIDAYVPPPVPTPGPEQARRIQVPSLDIDKPIFQGDHWDALRRGVGQHIGSAQPGQTGNMVLSAHNDIYGEIFRYLDRLEPGDEVIVYTERQRYTYVVRETVIVEPTEVWVMAPTDYASVTLISCYPYLRNNKRIVVFAELAELRS